MACSIDFFRDKKFYFIYYYSINFYKNEYFFIVILLNYL